MQKIWMNLLTIINRFYKITAQTYIALYRYLSRKVLFWLFKMFEIQKGRTFSFKGSYF